MDDIVAVQPPRADAPPGTNAYTCNTCGLTFPTADLQRLHMKTDWHRYNLKRRVASLPPITSEMFAEKMLQQKQQVDDESNRSRGTGRRQVTKKDKKREEKLLRKQATQRAAGLAADIERPSSPEGSVVSSSFSLGEPVHEGEYRSYGPAMSTTENEESEEDDEEEGEVTVTESTPVPERPRPDSMDEDDDDDAEEKEIKRRIARAVRIPPNVCLVDGKEFETVEDNVAYMAKKYGLFIPEREYLVDLEGLITYLGEKVGLGNMCLSCNFQGKSVESVRAHLVSKNHVRIPYETTEEKLEYSEFYDFTRSYGPSRRKAATAAVDGGADDDDEWEEVSDEEAMNVDDDDDDDFVGDENDLYTDGMELALAPGVRATHRSLQRYYRQSFRNTAAPTEGQGTVLAVDRRHNTSLLSRPVETKEQKQAWSDERRKQTIHFRRDKHVNNQPHYRDKLLQ